MTLPIHHGHHRGRAALGPRLVMAALVVTFTTVAATLVASPSARATTVSVTNCNDSGVGSLRQAVSQAASGDTITFALSPSCSLIKLQTTIDIGTNLTIDGPGASVLDVDESIYRTGLAVASGVTAVVSGLTIENGATGIDNAGALTLTDTTLLDNGSDSGGGIVNTGTLTVSGSTLSKNGVDVPDEGGGGIDNDGGTVTVTDSDLTDNTASGGAVGGGIDNDGGTVTVTDSTLSGNTTGDGGGGGIYNATGTVTITATTFSGNSALNGTGGAVDNSSGTVTLTDSTLRNNSAYYSSGGGGLDNGATMKISDSTFFGNNATFGGEGGAILNTGTLNVTASTLAHNSAADSGGGLYGPATVATSILAQNTEGGNCSQTVTDGGYNLADDATCGFTSSTDIASTSVGLAPGGPADNGGPTKTIALEADSPAINAVKNASSCATPDQRGTTRPTPCDIGSVQLSLPPQVITSPDRASATVGAPFSFTVTTTGVPVPSITREGKLPKGLTLVDNHNGTATIGGTPLKSGVYNFVIRSTYGLHETKTVVTQAFTLTVSAD